MCQPSGDILRRIYGTLRDPSPPNLPRLKSFRDARTAAFTGGQSTMFVAHRNVGVGSLASFLAQRSVVRFGSKKPTCNQACYHYKQQSLRHELTSIRRRPDASLHPLVQHLPTSARQGAPSNGGLRRTTCYRSPFGTRHHTYLPQPRSRCPTRPGPADGKLTSGSTSFEGLH